MPYRSLVALGLTALLGCSGLDHAPGKQAAQPDATDAGLSPAVAEQQRRLANNSEQFLPATQACEDGEAHRATSAHSAGTHAPNAGEAPPLHLAARRGHLDIAARLLQAGADVNAEDCTGATPLHAAAAHTSSIAMLTMLLTAGAKVDEGDLYNRTPLRFAAEFNSSLEVVTTLLSAGADATSAETSVERGKTQLHAAAKHNEIAGVMLALLNAGADVGAVMKYGITTLHLAAEFNTPEVLLLLLAARADVKSLRGARDFAMLVVARGGAFRGESELLAAQLPLRMVRGGA